MTLKAWVPAHGRLVIAFPALVFVLSACSSTRFGSELSANPKPHAIRTPQSTTLRLPQDEAFSIALPSATKKAGLDGMAEADAAAESTGRAEATASVTHSGSAESIFQLGHAFANDTERQIDLDFRVRFNYEFEAKEEPEVFLADALVSLRLYARDQRGRVLRDISLIDHSTENGAAQREADESLNFSVTLGPGRSLNVFLAGLTKVDIPTARSASASLKLSGLQFEVVTRPAPAVRVADDDRK